MAITQVWKSVVEIDGVRWSIVHTDHPKNGLLYSTDTWTQPRFGLILCWQADNFQRVLKWSAAVSKHPPLNWEVWLAEAELERPEPLLSVKYIPADMERWWKVTDPYKEPARTGSVYQSTRPWGTLGAQRLRLIRRLASWENE